MRFLYRSALAALTIVTVLVSASSALAAPAKWQSVDVTLHDEQPSPILLVSGTLPTSVKLPAQVELAVPSGGQFQWAGEILGGPVSQDPEVQYKISSKNGMDVYSFTLKQARTAQIEIVVPGAVQSNATGKAAAIKWIADQDVPLVNISTRVPQGSQVTGPAEGAQTIPGPTGFSYYQKTVKDVSAGDEVSLSFGYTPPTTSAGGAGVATGGTGGVALPLLIAIFAALLFFAGLAISKKMRPAEGFDEDDDYEDEGDDAQDTPVRSESDVEQFAFDDEDEESVVDPGVKPQSKRSKQRKRA